MLNLSYLAILCCRFILFGMVKTLEGLSDLHYFPSKSHKVNHLKMLTPLFLVKKNGLGSFFPGKHQLDVCGGIYYIPGTQMTIVLIGKDLVLGGPWLKIEDKQVPGTVISCF